MHCYTVGPWKDIVNDQVRKVKNSGLWDVTQKIHVGLLGSESFHIVNDKFEIHYGDNPEKFEGYTLDILQNTCASDDYVWYTHTKGVTHYYNPVIYNNVTNWRRLLEYFVIEQYGKCLQALQMEYDVAGALWRDTPFHFSGNIWWASGKHIINLPSVISWAKTARGFPERYNYEFWIGSRLCRALNLYDMPLLKNYFYDYDVGNVYRKPKIY